MKVKYVEATNIETLETKVTRELNSLTSYTIVGITHNVAISDSRAVYTAQIIYKHS